MLEDEIDEALRLLPHEQVICIGDAQGKPAGREREQSVGSLLQEGRGFSSDE
jgi:hypothetical protein